MTDINRSGVLNQLSEITKIPGFAQDGYVFKSLEAANWNRSLPYQLAILYVNDDGVYEPTDWRFTLPIPPQDLSISMPSADTVRATLGGINEVHGGAPFRNISLSGTMGIWPDRTSVNGGIGVENLLVANSALNAVRTVANLDPFIDNSVSNSVFPDAVTGFYRFWQLRQFLEGYIALRGAKGKITPKDEKYASAANIVGNPSSQLPNWEYEPNRLRLAFVNWKDSDVWVCKLQQFDMRRSSESALEYRYSLQLQAYKRVSINVDTKGYALRNMHRGAASLTKIISKASRALKALVNVSKGIALGIVGTIAAITEVARQVVGIVKDLAGVVRSIIDLPASIVREFFNGVVQIQQDWATVSNVFAQPPASVIAVLDKLPPDIKAGMGYVSRITDVSLSGGMPGSASNALSGGNQVDNQSAGNPATNSAGINIQDLLERAQGLLDLTLDQFQLTANMQKQVDAEIEKSLTVTLDYFAEARKLVQTNLDTFTGYIGSWNSVYNQTYGKDNPDAPQRTPTREELDVIFACNEILQSIDATAAYMRDNGGQANPPPTSMEYVSGLALQAGVPFNVSPSKYAVPVPYGASLEDIALQYLGDANRWHEIATLNGLRQPYIDEVGFSKRLITNGVANQITVADAENLFSGQAVFLTSESVRPTAGKIIAIDARTPGQVVLTLDIGDLDTFTLADDAVLRAYLPGTVNSKNFIYIPSSGLPNIVSEFQDIPGIDPTDPALRIGGIDWLLTNDLDLVVNESGDNPLSIGVTNMIQRAKVAFQTKPGNLLQHPNWGLNASVGVSSADLNVQDMAEALQTFFSQDPDFAGIRSAAISYAKNNLQIAVDIGVRGYNRSFPLRMSVNTP